MHEKKRDGDDELLGFPTPQQPLVDLQTPQRALQEQFSLKLAATSLLVLRVEGCGSVSIDFVFLRLGSVQSQT